MALNSDEEFLENTLLACAESDVPVSSDEPQTDSTHALQESSQETASPLQVQDTTAVVEAQGEDRVPCVRLRNVSVELDGQVVLSNVSFEVQKGEFVYVVGRSGSGKSALLRLLYADARLVEGEAEVMGFHLESLPHRKIPNLRRSMGVAFQDLKLFSDRTVYDNLALVLAMSHVRRRKVVADRIQRALASVGLVDCAQTRVENLSIGEQQRVALARILVRDPQLILADEPTGQLDHVTSSEIMQLLQRLAKEEGRTVIVATHDFMVQDKYPARMLACQNGTLTDHPL